MVTPLPKPANGKSYTKDEMIRYGILKPAPVLKNKKIPYRSEKIKSRMVDIISRYPSGT
jgi:hypothetical protein